MREARHTPLTTYIIITTVFMCLYLFQFSVFPCIASTSSKGRTECNIPYYKEIFHAANHHGIDPDLLAAIVKVESGFNPEAVGPSGALGLTQLMPRTARKMGVQDIMDPGENLLGGAQYLSRCLKIFDDEDLALAAYNLGVPTVKKFNKVPASSSVKRFITRVKAARDSYALRSKR